MGFFSAIIDSLTGSKVDHEALIASGAVVVDVRTKGEYGQGHATKSVNIPLSELPNKLNKLKGKTVVLVCRSGARAGQAKGILTRNGIEAHNAGAWQNVAD